MMANRILLIDDDPLAGLLTARELRAAGCTVFGPHMSVGTALSVLKARACDAAVIELKSSAPAITFAMHALAAMGKPFAILPDLPGGAVAPAFRDRPCLHRRSSAGEILAALDARE